ncbi:hypothetical protein CBER1_01838 [Cercospora berteroae]|uniref:Heterokaryon incompatibility domain-containing protein n=1 Tax=Cercospora berteroae TaxID=357750 RepID=A0A2S6CA96_9PEZI|nr:hypothetical protein CBER1_01838 [Cercospora berteroae]
MAGDNAGKDSAYEFQPCSESEIRLVTIEPAPDYDSDIHCLITHHSREDQARYDAISYSWGSDNSHSTIFCNDRQLNVTKSCELAIKALRHSSEPKMIWIDAVCIDQSNMVDKSRQVARMGDVYVNAACTFIQLGESEKIWDICDTESENSHWISLLERQWFTRTWVVQEVVLSRSLILVIGNQRIAWLDLMALCNARSICKPELFYLRAEVSHDYARRIPKSWAEQDAEVLGESLAESDKFVRHSELVLPSYSHDDNTNAGSCKGDPMKTTGVGAEGGYTKSHSIVESPSVAARSVLAHEPAMNRVSGHTNLPYWRLLGILERTRHFECSDARDKLYAILPLFAKPIPEILLPNYEKTIEETYTDLSWFILHDGQSELFANAQSSGPLPSWVADWRLRPTTEKLEEAAEIYGPALQWRNSWRAGFQLEARELLVERVAPDRIQLRGLEAEQVIGVVRRACKRIQIHSNTQTVELSFAVTLHESRSSTSVTCKSWKPAEQNLTGRGIHAYREVRLAVEKTLARKDQCLIEHRKDRGHVNGKSQPFRVWRASASATSDAGLSQVKAAFDELQNVLAAFDGIEHYDCEDLSRPADFVERQTVLSRGRCILQTSDDKLAVGPGSSKVTDLVCILFGFSTPFVLRQAGDEFKLLGECCMMSSMMAGANIDAWAARPGSEQHARDYVLI